MPRYRGRPRPASSVLAFHTLQHGHDRLAKKNQREQAEAFRQMRRIRRNPDGRARVADATIRARLCLVPEPSRWRAADFDYRCRSSELAARTSHRSIAINLDRSRQADRVTSRLRHSPSASVKCQVCHVARGRSGLERPSAGPRAGVRPDPSASRHVADAGPRSDSLRWRGDRPSAAADRPASPVQGAPVRPRAARRSGEGLDRSGDWAYSVHAARTP